MKAAERMAEKERLGLKVDWANPFKKPWGTQKDGDLWQQAWRAIIRKGVSNQRLRKVKGHATQCDIDKGISTAKNKEGNDKSDKNVDDGVDKVGGKRPGEIGKLAS